MDKMITIRFLKEIYPKIAVIKSAYAFTDRAYVHLDAEGDYYLVNLKPKEKQDPVSEDEFINEMLCQSVRHEVLNQTRSLRELLFARAAASSYINPEQKLEDLFPEVDENETEILTDWFEKYDSAAK